MTASFTTEETLHILSEKIWTVLSKKILGIYLFGSYINGDFDELCSDIDLLVVTRDALLDTDVYLLKEMHKDFFKEYPEWRDRIDIAYIPKETLAHYKEKICTVLSINPGDPLRFVQVGKEWLVHWYFIQEDSIPLIGPPIKEIMELISHKEFFQAVYEYALTWNIWINQVQNLPSQAYAILSLCRAFCQLEKKDGKQITKKQAAEWVKNEFPQWKFLINKAFLWRENWRHEKDNASDEFKFTKQFAEFMSEKILQIPL